MLVVLIGICPLQGETFDVPEVVPFRLTQNMIHAMVCKLSYCMGINNFGFVPFCVRFVKVHVQWSSICVRL